jgi:hypothetical protein
MAFFTFQSVLESIIYFNLYSNPLGEGKQLLLSVSSENSGKTVLTGVKLSMLRSSLVRPYS